MAHPLLERRGGGVRWSRPYALFIAGWVLGLASFLSDDIAFLALPAGVLFIATGLLLLLSPRDFEAMIPGQPAPNRVFVAVVTILIGIGWTIGGLLAL